MATKQAKNVNKVTPTVPHMAGSVHTQIVQFAINQAVNAADVVEVAALPAHCKLTAVDLISANIAAVATLDVGFLTGQYGDTLDVRTVDNTLFSAAAKNAAASVPVNTLFAVNASGVDRGIGFKLSANEAAGTGTVTLRISYVAS